MRKILRGGCLLMIVFVGLCGLLYAVSPHPPVTPQANISAVGQAAPTEASPTEAYPTQTDAPAVAASIDPSVLATQAFFTHQQTQAAGGQAVQQAQSVAPTNEIDVQPAAMTVVYAQGSVNVRSCPQKSCNLVGSLGSGQSVEVIGSTSGEAIQNNDPTWYQVQVGSQDGFVYSEFVSEDLPTVAPNPNAQQNVSIPPTVIYAENCMTAVAMGLNAQQIAQKYPELDHDSDGSACYGS